MRRSVPTRRPSPRDDGRSASTRSKPMGFRHAKCRRVPASSGQARSPRPTASTVSDCRKQNDVHGALSAVTEVDEIIVLRLELGQPTGGYVLEFVAGDKNGASIRL